MDGGGGGGGGGGQPWWPTPADFRLGLHNEWLNFANAGYFDPRGNPQLIEAGRQNAANVSGNLQRQMQLATSMMGLDPAQRATYRLQGMLGAQGQQAQLTNEALMDAWRRMAEYAERMSLGRYGITTDPQRQRSGQGVQLGFGPASIGVGW
jgi:hypothetical protein